MSSRKRRRSEGAVREPEEQTAVCRITYHVDERVFDRVFNEESLEDMRDVIRKKLKLPDAEFELTQLREGMEIDLEDDDDFFSLRAQAQIDSRIDVLVTVLGAPADWSFSRAATPAPDAHHFERGRSVEPAAAPRRRSVSFGGVTGISIPAVASLMRGKGLLPARGGAVFDDDDDEEEGEKEMTLGQKAKQVRKRASAGAEDVRDAAEGAKKKTAAAARKKTAKTAKEPSILQEASDTVAAVGKTAAKAGKTATAVLQDAGEAAAETVVRTAKAAKRAMQMEEEEPPAKRRKKSHPAEDTTETGAAGADVSMTAAPAAAPAEEEAPVKEKPKGKKRKSDAAAPDEPAEPPTAKMPASEPEKPKKKAKKPTSIPNPDPPVPSSSAPLPSSTPAEPIDISSLDPVDQIFARAALKKKSKTSSSTPKPAPPVPSSSAPPPSSTPPEPIDLDSLDPVEQIFARAAMKKQKEAELGAAWKKERSKQAKAVRDRAAKEREREKDGEGVESKGGEEGAREAGEKVMEKRKRKSSEGEEGAEEAPVKGKKKKNVAAADDVVEEVQAKKKKSTEDAEGAAEEAPVKEKKKVGRKSNAEKAAIAAAADGTADQAPKDAEPEPEVSTAPVKEKKKVGRKSNAEKAAIAAAAAAANGTADPASTEVELEQEGLTVAKKKSATKKTKEKETEKEVVQELEPEPEEATEEVDVPGPVVKRPRGKPPKKPETVAEIVIDVPAKRTSAKTRPAAKRAQTTVTERQGGDDDAEEEEPSTTVDQVKSQTKEQHENIASTPRSNVFLDRLVNTSTPSQASPRRSPVNSLGFPAQLERATTPASKDDSATPRRFQDALAQALAITPGRGDVHDEILEFSQASQQRTLSKSQSKVLHSPFAATISSSGKVLRPLSKLPRPSLTKTPGWYSTSESPTGPPVPSPKAATNGAALKVPSDARQPSASPLQHVLGGTPRASPLPTWTSLPAAPSSSPAVSANVTQSQVDQLRSSSSVLGEEISRPGSAVAREEEAEVEQATQEQRSSEDEGGAALQLPDLEVETTTDDRTKAGEEGSDEDEDDALDQGTPKLGALGPPAQSLDTVSLGSLSLSSADDFAAAAMLELSRGPATSQSLGRSPRQAASQGSQPSSQPSKRGSDGSLVSYPSIPTPKAASQPLFRPETQAVSQPFLGTYPSASVSGAPEDDLHTFGMASQYVGLSQLSKEGLRRSMSRNSLANNSVGSGSLTKLKSPKGREPESETEDEEDEEDEEDSELEDSILPRNRMAGAKKAMRGRPAVPFF